jgi:protocatechuate 4,5-dioxygenase alpha subunit
MAIFAPDRLGGDQGITELSNDTSARPSLSQDMAAFADIPGTTVFTAQMSRRGFHLNQFCMSLMHPENRVRFKAGETAYLDGWKLTDAQKDAVRRRDYNAMVAEGGNIYFLAKISATDGLPFQRVAASMSGLSQDEYAAMMIAGGRSPDGNRSRKEEK